MDISRKLKTSRDTLRYLKVWQGIFSDFGATKKDRCNISAVALDSWDKIRYNDSVYHGKGGVSLWKEQALLS
jgi:hypothetical protein